MPNYGEYTRNDLHAAGEFWSGAGNGAPVGKWAWAPGYDGASTNTIQWGHPTNWPPDYRELFDRATATGVDAMWLRGWYDNGTFYEMHIDRQLKGNADGTGLVERDPHPQGWQLYALWSIPAEPYLLDAYGHLVELSSGNTVHFYHRIIWYPPAMIANRYWPKRDCLKQWEYWEDDNPELDGNLVLKVKKTNYLARGAGMAWATRQTFPQLWNADLKSWWLWPR